MLLLLPLQTLMDFPPPELQKLKVRQILPLLQLKSQLFELQD